MNASDYYQKREATIANIAREVLGFESLERVGHDAEDFREVYLPQLRRALRNAFVAGFATGLRYTEDQQVEPACACPRCNNRDQDTLIWVASGQAVRCQNCGTVYDPQSLDCS